MKPLYLNVNNKLTLFDRCICNMAIYGCILRGQMRESVKIYVKMNYVKKSVMSVVVYFELYLNIKYKKVKYWLE